MIKKDKNLLLIDLCARLPYNVMVCYDNKVCTVDAFVDNSFIISETPNAAAIVIYPKDIKPYLLPLSSMTDEQKKELNDTLISLSLKSLSDEVSSEVIATYEIDFYNKNHFDYRGLILKGIAIDATNLNIYGKRI